MANCQVCDQVEATKTCKRCGKQLCRSCGHEKERNQPHTGLPDVWLCPTCDQ